MKLFSLFLFCILWLSCSDQPRIQEYLGEAQGTTYHIKLVSLDGTDHSAAIDSILVDIDQSMSLYLDNSTINKVNGTDTIIEIDLYFHQVFNASKDIYIATQGAFDPAVLPLVKGWGFGKDKTPTIDSTKMDSLLALVDFQGVSLGLDHQLNLDHALKRYCDSAQVEIKYVLNKNKPHIQLDFNGIAQGFTVDVISDYLLNYGVNNYMIELGGEVIARGRKPNNQPWKIGIDQPLENADERKLQAIVPLVNKAMATSGNYRQFYVQNGIKYAHTINPKTGYPVTHSLLSATVITNDCALADGYATAFMVMGIDRSKEFLRINPQLGLDVLFIYANAEGEWETFASEGMKELIQQVD